MSITLHNDCYTVSGKILNTIGKNVSSFIVKVCITDIPGKDDYVASAVTNEDGLFEIKFSEKDFACLFDQKPDMFFMVYDAATIVLNTRDSITIIATTTQDDLSLTIAVPDKAQGSLPKQNTVFLNGLATAPGFKMTTSSELMDNYRQVELISQQKKFLVAQTSNGYSLFFSVGTDDKFYITQEKVGTVTGWQQTDLSACLLAGAGKVNTFDIAQNQSTGDIDIALAITDASGTDHLYLSFGNSFSSLTWINSIEWIEIVDDRVNHPTGLVIESIYLASRSGASYTVVDTKGANNYLTRYWIHQNGKPQWVLHDLQINLDANGLISSQIGRIAHDNVDGIYTLGQLTQTLELTYTEVHNAFNLSAAPKSIVLNISDTALKPNNAAFSLCDAASGNKGETDLFIAGGGKLYYYAADRQIHQNTPVQVYENDLFLDVRQLYAFNLNSKIVIWGLNNADQIFYLSCLAKTIITPSAWSVPLPIQSGISKVSPYVNCNNNGNTFFANAGSGKIIKGLQDPDSSLWKMEQIDLPPLTTNAKATKALSYTTTVYVTDEKNNPAPNIPITLTPKSRTNVFINNLYYSLDNNPIIVNTDTNGGINIIEWVNGLAGTSFNFHLGDSSVVADVSPMQNSLDKIGKLNTADALTKATVTNHDGTQRSLIPITVSPGDVVTLAASICNLNTAYQGMITSANRGVQPMLLSGVANPFSYIESVAGDVLSWIKNTTEEYIIELKSISETVWHFLVTIGGKVYGFILDTVEKIGGALEAIWNNIVHGIKDLIDYVKFLFEWQDVVRTKDAMKQLIRIYFKSMADDLQSARISFDEKIFGAEQTIKDWAGVPDSLRPALGGADHSLDASLASAVHSQTANSAPCKMLSNHFISNVGNSNSTLSEPVVTSNPTWSGLTDLSDFVTAQDAILKDLTNNIKNLLLGGTNPLNPSVSEILKKIIADISISGLEVFKLTADKILDFLTLLMDEIIKALDTPIYIPIVSDILDDLFGITLPSVLDVLCLIGALPATIIYKGLHGKAPFPGGAGSLTEKITSSTTLAELKAAFGSSTDEIILSNDAKGAIYEISHIISGIGTMIKGVLVSLDEEADGAAKTVLATPITITSVIACLSLVVGNLFVMHTPLHNPVMKAYASVVSKIAIIQTVAFLVAPKAITKIKGLKDTKAIEELGKQVGVVSDAFSALLAFVGLVPPAYHIYEIIDDGVAATPDGVLGIMECSSDITSKLSTITGFAALVDEEEISKQVLIVIQSYLTEITGGLQIEEALLDAC